MIGERRESGTPLVACDNVTGDRGWGRQPKWRLRIARWVFGVSDRLVRRLEQPEQTLERRKQLLERQIRVWGDEGMPTTNCRILIADTLEELGRWEEALPLRERICAACSRNLGEEHDATLDARRNLVLTLSSAGRSEQARGFAQRLRDVGRSRGADDPFERWAENFLQSGSESPTANPAKPNIATSWTMTGQVSGQLSDTSSTGTARIFWSRRRPKRSPEVPPL